LYRFAPVAVDEGPLRAAGGLRVSVAQPLAHLEQAHTVVIPGWRGIDAPVPAPLCDALRHAHARGARLITICSGAFVLARAGLLKGRRATTHWRYLEALAAVDADIEVDGHGLYVEQDRIFTSAGSAAGLDLCLHVVREDYGAGIANNVARRLVLPAHRQGGQAQFVPAPMGRASGPIGPLQERLLARLDQPWEVADMARLARVSRRTLLRRFREATGTSPTRRLLTQRLQRARDLLEAGEVGVESVASACGLGSPESLRHHFRRAFGISPTGYRRAFRAGRTGQPSSSGA
jgi:AraC family transcriptional activator FtrA